MEFSCPENGRVAREFALALAFQEKNPSGQMFRFAASIPPFRLDLTRESTEYEQDNGCSNLATSIQDERADFFHRVHSFHRST